MRVRGLKQSRSEMKAWIDASHPVRVRGLKHEERIYLYIYEESHPVRVRGLKLSVSEVCLYLHWVAPRAGAWIETESSGCETKSGNVAPRAGAWIETAHGRAPSYRRGRTPCGCVD